jgi:Tfp pilus assembly PilM family ATPase/Tfp pilus assembly protein PilN
MAGLLGNRKFVAIDYDSREVRLVVFRLVRKVPTILAAESVAVEEGLDIADAEALGRFLRPTIGRLGLRNAAAVMCVGRTQAVLKSLQLPAEETGELAAMVQFQVSRELPFPAEEGVVDFTRAEHFDVSESAETGGTPVLAAAVRLEAVDVAGRLCDQAGLRLERLGLRPQANLRAVGQCVRTEPGERLLLVNITADEVEIDFFADETLEFSRAATLAVPDAADDGGDRQGAIRRVVLEVNRSLQSFQAMQGGGQVDACLVAGGTGIEEPVVAALADSLRAPSEMLDPAGGFALPGDGRQSRFVACLGLASGQSAAALPFDFVNPKRPPEPRDTRRPKALAVVAAAMAAVLLGFFLHTRVLGQRRDAVDELAAEVEKIEDANRGLRIVEKRVEKIQQWRQEKVDWLDQLACLSQRMPGAGDVYLTSLRGSSSGTLALSGQARDSRDLHAFAAGMKELGYQGKLRGTDPKDRDRHGYTLKFSMDLLAEDSRPVVAAGEPAGRPADDAAPGAPERSGRRRRR